MHFSKSLQGIKSAIDMRPISQNQLCCYSLLYSFLFHFWNFPVPKFRQFFFVAVYRSSHPEVFLRKGVLKICSKVTGEHTCGSAISIKLLCNFIEITFRYRCSPASLLHIFRTPFLKNTSGWLLLSLIKYQFQIEIAERIACQAVAYFSCSCYDVIELGY